jgi:hypothetical protein
MAQNQSAKIRARYAKGQEMGPIAKALGIRYQTVWRTLNRKFKGVVPVEARAAKQVVEAAE